MLGYRALVIQKELRKFDNKLFINQNYKGELQIMRESFKQVPYDVDGIRIMNIEPNHHYICSLTENWTSRTQSVDWGILPILDHMRSIDCQNKDSLVNKLEEMHMKDAETKKKDFKNKTEDFCRYQLRDAYMKATSDINTSNLEKIDLRRKKERY